MGGGVSRPQTVVANAFSGNSVKSKSRVSAISTKSKSSISAPVDKDIPPEVSRQPTSSIDARIIQTLQQLNLSRRQAESKRPMNFERVVLRFHIARDAFETIHCIYYQYADEHGLRFEGLKAALDELGAKMEECDMREIFYESDMVRDDTLTHSEFVVSLAIAFLLGLISNFECILRTLPPPVETTAVGGSSEGRSSVASARADASAKISKTLELIVTAYLLFDEDASGTIQIGEVRKVMQKHNESTSRRTLERKSSGMTTKAIRNARIQEMDLNSDGTITFQEFVLTFQKWVGIDEV